MQSILSKFSIGDFFVTCSGANKQILEACPTERVKFIGIGATIFLTAVLASISGGYAIYFTFKILFISLLFGLLWGAIIFNLDRYIVSSIRKKNSLKREFLSALPRFFIAIVLAFTISKPLEIKLFDGSISKKMGEIEDAYNKNGEIDFNKRRNELDQAKSGLFTELEKKKNAIYSNDPIFKDLINQKDILQKKIEELTNQINNNSSIIYQNSWMEEILINPETGEKRKERKFNQLALNKIDENRKLNVELANNKINERTIENNIQIRKTDLTDQVKKIELQIESQTSGIQKQIEDLNLKRPEILAKVKSDAALDKDILSRLRALSELKSFGNSVWWASLMITALFILLECAPITVKLLSPRGPYDEILDRIEYEIYVEQQKIISNKNDAINNELLQGQDLNKFKRESQEKLEKLKFEKEFITNESIIDEIAKKQINLAKVMIDKWYAGEASKIE